MPCDAQAQTQARPKFEFRPMTERDVPWVAKLDDPLPAGQRWSEQKIARYLRRPNRFAYCIEADDYPIAWILVAYRPDAFLNDIAVLRCDCHQDLRDCRFVPELFAWAHLQAARLECARTVAYTREHDLDRQTLLKSLGYTYLETFKAHYPNSVASDHEDCYLFARLADPKPTESAADEK